MLFKTCNSCVENAEWQPNSLSFCEKIRVNSHSAYCVTQKASHTGSQQTRVRVKTDKTLILRMVPERNAHGATQRVRMPPQNAVSRFWYTDSVFAYYMGALPGPPFLVKPAQRYLPEVLCCRKGIIQSLIPCHTATKWDNNTPYEACLSGEIIKVVNDKPPFLSVPSCQLCWMQFVSKLVLAFGITSATRIIFCNKILLMIDCFVHGFDLLSRF